MPERLNGPDWNSCVGRKFHRGFESLPLRLSTEKSDDPAWPLVREWSREATNQHRLIDADDAVGIRALESLEGVTEWSVLGALARNAQVLAVEDWLFVLGAGGGGHPGLPEFNQGDDGIAGALTVAVDVLGGTFAINGGDFRCGEPGEVCYLGPDDLEWMACEMGHSAFVRWALGGDVGGFYADLRWEGWRDDVAALEPGQGIIAMPPPFTKEGKQPGVKRAAVPLREARGVLLSFADQLERSHPSDN